MKYYKVVNIISKPAIIDTKSSNYGQTLPKLNQINNLLQFIVSSSENLNLPLDFYFIINNELVNSGQKYLTHFQNIPNNTYKFSDLGISNNTNYKISKTDLCNIIQSIFAINYGIFDEGFYLWEYLYERYKTNKKLPNRLNSFFLFDNKQNCNFYINNHKKGGVICEVDLMHTENIFKGDMNLLDTIENDFTANQAKIVVEKYWNGHISTNPIFEYVFQGKCELKP